MFPNDPFIRISSLPKIQILAGCFVSLARGRRGVKSAGKTTSSESTLDLIFIRWREKKELNILLFDRQPNQNRQVQSFCLWRTHTHSLTNTLTYRFSTCLGPSWGLPACIAMGDWQRVSTRGEVRLRLSELTSHESLKRLCFHLHLSERVIPCCDSSTVSHVCEQISVSVVE